MNAVTHLLIALAFSIFVAAPRATAESALARSSTPSAADSTARATSSTTRATVISITDGDTIIVAHNGTPEKIRLVDVDSPEKSQPFGRAAKRRLSDLVYMREVTIDRRGKDRYGRTLATIIRDDGTNINEELVRSGHAWVYKAASAKSIYKVLESEARQSRRGLWSDQAAIAPWQFRSQRKLRPPERNDIDGLIRQLLKERLPAPKNFKSSEVNR